MIHIFITTTLLLFLSGCSGGAKSSPSILDKRVHKMKALCSMDNGLACYNLAKIFETGDGKIKPDIIQAFKYYKHAELAYKKKCDQVNDLKSCQKLAFIYQKGAPGVPINKNMSFKYHKKTCLSPKTTFMNEHCRVFKQHFIEGKYPDPCTLSTKKVRYITGSCSHLHRSNKVKSRACIQRDKESALRQQGCKRF